MRWAVKTKASKVYSTCESKSPSKSQGTVKVKWDPWSPCSKCFTSLSHQHHWARVKPEETGCGPWVQIGPLMY